MAFPAPDALDDRYIRAVVQSGSFVRWVVDTHGVEALERLLDGERLERVTDLYFPDAQRAWLSALDMKDIELISCLDLEQANTVTYALCSQIE